MGLSSNEKHNNKKYLSNNTLSGYKHWRDYREYNNQNKEIEKLRKEIEELKLEHNDKDQTILELVEVLDRLTNGKFSNEI